MSEKIKKLNVSKPLLLDCKKTVKDFPLAYETYGNLNKDDSGTKNSWGTTNEDFYGIVLNFDFKVNSKIDIGLNLTSLSESLSYRGKTLDKNILGIDFKYRF